MKRSILLFFLITALSFYAAAQVPGTISYQGYLTKVNGSPADDGAHTVKFDFYDGSTKVLERGPISVTTDKGLFTTIIGSGSANNAAFTPAQWTKPYTVKMTVDGAELANEVTLTSVPYAIVAGSVDGANITGATAKLNNLTYAFPSAQGAANTFLSNNGSGTLSWANSPLSGSGTAGQITLWSGSSTFTGSTNLIWDNANTRLGIGGTPAVPLHVKGNGNVARFEGTNQAVIELYPDGGTTREGFLGYNNAADDNLKLMNESTGKLVLGVTTGGIEIGSGVTASGTNSIVIGTNAVLSGSGSVYITDNSVTTTQTANNRFYARFDNGYRLLSNAAETAGVFLSPAGTSWTVISDSTKKENFKIVDGEKILKGFQTLKLGTWSYKFNDKRIRHYGPYAQDFFNLFGKDGIGVIGSDTAINSQDIEGLNFTAIHALVKRTNELLSAVEELQALKKEAARRDDEMVELKKSIETMKVEVNYEQAKMRDEVKLLSHEVFLLRQQSNTISSSASKK